MKVPIFISLFIYSLLYTPTSRTLDDLSCGQHELLRKECGYGGITQSQCEQKNCCWKESSINKVPWCFQGIDDVPTYYTIYSSKSCALDRNLRTECGYKGIEKAECESRDCCYRIDDYESVVPWCFHGYVDTKTVTKEEKAVYSKYY